MREEAESIYIYTTLIKNGYKIHQHGDTWTITEPESRKHPQQHVAVRSMREASMWADGVEQIRFIRGLK